MGAAYVLTGSVNQACVEAGTSEAVRRLLAEARQADVAMAPAADMFEMGVKVQVLKRGTMFAQRAAKLYELYASYDRLEDIPEKHRILLERDIFKCSLEEEWQQTKTFFMQRDPRQIDRAEQDPRHKMALVFRSYLGQSSRWATTGHPGRKMDYQIWCGPINGRLQCLGPGIFSGKTRKSGYRNHRHEPFVWRVRSDTGQLGAMPRRCPPPEYRRVFTTAAEYHCKIFAIALLSIDNYSITVVYE